MSAAGATQMRFRCFVYQRSGACLLLQISKRNLNPRNATTLCLCLVEGSARV